MTQNENTDSGSLADRAYLIIEEAIVTLKLAPGSVITELDLSALTGIGRTPIRAAVQRLAREKLIKVLPKRGLLVAPLDLLGERKLLELRREVEDLICRCAAARASPQQRRKFAELAQAFKTAAADGDDIAFSRCDRKFGECCIEAARNEYVGEAMRLFVGLARRSWYFHQQQGADLRSMALLHAELATAISKGEVLQTRDTLKLLLDAVEKAARSTLWESHDLAGDWDDSIEPSAIPKR